MNIKVFKSFDKELEEIWQSVDYCANSCFQMLQWQKTWWNIVGTANNYKLNVLVIYDDVNVVAIFPICYQQLYPFSGFPLSILKGFRWLGFPQTDYNGAIFNELITVTVKNHAWELILKWLKRNKPFSVSCLQNTYKEDIDYIESIKNRVKRTEIDAPFAEISDWNSYYKTIKSKVRNDTKRQISRLEKIGDLTYIHATSEIEAYPIIDEMISFKKARYVATGVDGILDGKSFCDFYYELFKEIPNNIHVSALKLNGEVIACHWGAVHKNVFYYLMPAYSFKYHKYSPGRILQDWLMEQQSKNDINIFDFTWGGEAYKKTYCKDSKKIYNLKFINF